jgi:hypothetical protein
VCREALARAPTLQWGLLVSDGNEGCEGEDGSLWQRAGIPTPLYICTLPSLILSLPFCTPVCTRASGACRIPHIISSHCVTKHTGELLDAPSAGCSLAAYCVLDGKGRFPTGHTPTDAAAKAAAVDPPGWVAARHRSLEALVTDPLVHALALCCSPRLAVEAAELACVVSSAL